MIIKKHISNILIYSVGLTPLLSIKLAGLSIILFATGAFLKFTGQPIRTSSKKIIFWVLCISMPALMQIIFLTFSGALFENLKILETSIPLVLFPLVFCVAQPLRKQEEVHLFYRIFILSSALLSLICLARIAYVAPQHNFESGDWLRGELENIPIVAETSLYMSLLLFTGLLLLLIVPFKTIWISWFIGSIILITLLLAGSRASIVALAIIGLIEFFKLAKNKLNFAIVAIVLVTLLFFTGSLQKKRFLEPFTTQSIFPQGMQYNSFNIRMAIYKCSLELIGKNFWWGVGVENTLTKLNECYKQFDTPAFTETDYNTHNQYFDFLLTYGIFGFLLIVSAYFVVFQKIFARHNSKEKYILLAFLVQFLFENFLSRSTGVVTFSLFVSVFVFCNTHESNEKTIP